MVRESEIIKVFRSRFRYEDGKLFCIKTNRPRGYLSTSGYVRVNVNLGYKVNKAYYAHQVIFALHHNRLPKLVDHINQNKLDNRVENLREADKSINSINRPLQKNNLTGVRGVAFNKLTSKYEAYITVKSKRLHLGLFITKEQATEARLNAEKLYW